MPPGAQGQTQVPLPGHSIPSLFLSAGRPILPGAWCPGCGGHCSWSGTCPLLRRLGCDGGRVPPDTGPPAEDMLDLDQGFRFSRSLGT